MSPGSEEPRAGQSAPSSRVSSARSQLGGKFRGASSADAKETTAAVMSGFVIYGLGILTGPIIVRTLGVEGRGDVQVLMLVHQVAVFLVSFGVPGAAAFYADRRRHGTLAGTGLMLSIVYSAPFVALGWWRAPSIAGDGEADLTMWLRVSMLLIPLGIFHLLATEMLRSTTAGVRFNVHRNSPVILRTFFIVGAAIAGVLTLNTALGLSVAAFAIAYLVSTIAVLERDRWRTDFRLAVDLTSYGLRRWLSIAANTLLIRLDQIIMIPLLPRRDLGIYVVAVTVAGVLRPVSSGFGSVILAQLRRGNRSQEKVLRQSVMATAYSLVGVATMIAATAWFLVPLIYGSETVPSVAPLLVLLPGEVFAGVATVYNGYLSAQGAPGRASVAKLISAVYTVLLLLIMIPLWGIMGAAVVTTTSYLLELIIVFAMTKRMAPEDLDIPDASLSP